MQLRKICQHPFLFESVEDKICPIGVIDDNIWRCAGKFELLTRILPKLSVTGYRVSPIHCCENRENERLNWVCICQVLVFFQMTKVTHIVEDFLKSQNWQHIRLDGAPKAEERASHAQFFNAANSPYKIFILSTRAGGLGLNVQTATQLSFSDSDWNPHAGLQAQDRVHWIGQMKAVRILRLVTGRSVEEAMYARVRYKLDIDDRLSKSGGLIIS